MQNTELYRRIGIKNATRLKAPDFVQAANFTIPYDTVLCYLPHDDLSLGPNASWTPLTTCDSDISVDSLKIPTSKEGARVQPFQLDTAIKEYHQKHRRFTKMRALETAARNKSTLIIENYALLTKPLLYPKSWYRIYNKAMNYFNDAFADVAKVVNELPNRTFILPLDTPNKAFTREQYNRVTSKVQREWLEDFDTSEALLHAQLYRYLLHAETLVADPEKVKDELTKLATDPDHANNPWFKLPVAQGERIWLLAMSGNSMALVSLERLLKIVASEGINAFIHFTNAMFEENTQLELPDDDENIEVIFGADGRVMTAKEQALLAQGVDAANVPDGIKTPEQVQLVKYIREEGGKGGLSQREQNYLIDQASKLAKITAPDGKTPLTDYVQITPEDLAIVPPPRHEPHPLAGDVDYQRNRNVDMIAQYNQRLMQKDVLRAVLSFQRSGVIITDVKYDMRKDAAGAKHYYEVSLTTPKGKSSKFHFDFPVVEDSGRFTLNGTEVFFTPQRCDVPIRKVKPTQVKLTSYDGSMFITRGRLKKFSYSGWLMEELRQLANNGDIETRNRNVADYEHPYPRAYTLMGSAYERIKKGDVELKLNPKRRELNFGADTLKRLEKHDRVVIGTRKNDYLTMDMSENVYVHTAKGEELVGSVDELLGITGKNVAVDAAEVKIFSKQIPLGLVLGQRIGLDALIRSLKVQPRTFPTGERGQTILPDEYTLEFADKTYVFSKTDRQATLVMNSFNIVKKYLKDYNAGDFNKSDVYLSVLEDMGLGLRYYLEIDNIYDLFLDPTTLDLLKEMKEPTDMTGLFLRSAELLTTEHSPHEVDPDFMRTRHYERFSGFVYKAMSDGVRVQRSRPQGSKAPISIDPKRVIMAITTDSSKNMVETSNPARNVREKSFISYAGEGGRTAQTMTPELRIFHPNELGQTSADNTADSGKVALNASRVHDPLIKDLRGLKYSYDAKEHNEAQLFTTVALLVPGVDRDELKRLNFVSTQYDSVYPIAGYRPMPLHTPMEYELPYMVDKEFASMAKEDGKVLSVGELGIKVLYKSGKEDNILTGRMFGRVAGTVIPHEVVTDLKPGQRFKLGDALAWNQAYFERDRFMPNRLAHRSAKIIPTVFLEVPATFEDSTTFWEGVAADYAADVTKERYIHVPFGTALEEFVSVGDHVEDSDALCVMVPEHLQSEGLVTNETLASLKELGKDAPKANCEGVIERIEVFYYGQKEDMHPSIRRLANASDRHRKALVEKHGQVNMSDNGMVVSPVNFAGTKIEPNHAMIKLYITKQGIPLVSGSKTVVGANLKNTIVELFKNVITMVDSDEVAHAYFSYNGQNNRIVLSALEQGLGCRALILSGQDVVKIYRGN